MKPLILHLKREYWQQIRDGLKPFEYRLFNEYWKKRLLGRRYSHIELKLGYPAKGDESRVLKRKWNGFVMLPGLCHEHFGPKPVDVFAIDVKEPLK